ncbi:hypothetical protein E2C01_032811 [Portunus trituberculatus]|uniref:Uncharacterized protein n=1 Tax=Portunus trituberculatus TaxID=210409 RepID=A0A5B7EW79_PORTR|nr:hypothetical protein [Portunus trituberculatus]
MEYPLIAKFRPQGHDLYSLIDQLLDSTTLRDILKEYPQFAPRLERVTPSNVKDCQALRNAVRGASGGAQPPRLG